MGGGGVEKGVEDLFYGKIFLCNVQIKLVLSILNVLSNLFPFGSPVFFNTSDIHPLMIIYTQKKI